MKNGSQNPKNRFRQEIGRRGEERAAAFLLAKGFQLLAKNWRCKAGEIDLIVEREGDIRFVEVKTRRSATYGLPEEAITPTKIVRLRATAEAWLLAHEGRSMMNYQVDVITLYAPDTPEEQLKWIEQIL